MVSPLWRIEDKSWYTIEYVRPCFNWTIEYAGQSKKGGRLYWKSTIERKYYGYYIY